MTPKGILAYIAGLVILLVGCGLSGVIILFAFALPARPIPEGMYLLIASAVLVFAALHLLAAGMYRMLVHLYHTISRTDLAGDRRLRGRTLFLLGQIGAAALVPLVVLFLALAASEAGRRDHEMGLMLLGVLPLGFFTTVSVLALLGGLGIMVRDLFIRNEDIVLKREAERRRRIEEQDADEPPTEVLPATRTTIDDLRERVRRDR